MTTSTRVRAARDLYRLIERERTDRGAGPDGAGGAAVVRDVADAVLDGLRAVVPFDCAMLGAWNAVTGQHTLLADRDLPPYLRPWTESKQSVNPRFVAVEKGGTPRRQTDVPPRQLWAEELYQVFLHPHGLNDGFAACLWTDDGRPMGTLALDTIEKHRIDDVALDLVVMLASPLAALVDPVPPARPLSADLADGLADGLVVTGAGKARALTPGADVDLAHPTGPLWPMIHDVLVTRRRSGSALLLAGDRVVAVSVEAGKHGALVLHRRVTAPFGLSVRELEILDALADGPTNAELAVRFRIAPRTVATYIERLLAKTGCPNRTAAARLAAHLHLVTATGTRAGPVS